MAYNEFQHRSDRLIDIAVIGIDLGWQATGQTVKLIRRIREQVPKMPERAAAFGGKAMELAGIAVSEVASAGDQLVRASNDYAAKEKPEQPSAGITIDNSQSLEAWLIEHPDNPNGISTVPMQRYDGADWRPILETV